MCFSIAKKKVCLKLSILAYMREMWVEQHNAISERPPWCKLWHSAIIEPSTFFLRSLQNYYNHLNMPLIKIQGGISPLGEAFWLSISYQCFHNFWFLQFSPPCEKKQTDVIAISLGERQHRCVNKAWLLQSKWSLSKHWLVWLSSDPGTQSHGVAPGLQTDRDSSSYYKSGSDHPNTGNK